MVSVPILPGDGLAGISLSFANDVLMVTFTTCEEEVPKANIPELGTITPADDLTIVELFAIVNVLPALIVKLPAPRVNVPVIVLLEAEGNDTLKLALAFEKVILGGLFVADHSGRVVLVPAFVNAYSKVAFAP